MQSDSDQNADAASRAWLLPTLLVLVVLLVVADWVLLKAVGRADALECARADCSPYQDLVRTLTFVAVPGLIRLTLIGAVEVFLRRRR